MNNLLFTNDYLAQFRLRTARHKRRMQHKDFEKGLRALDREHHELYNQQGSLGWIELDTPIMRGWKRYFVLRDDVLRSRQKSFFETLLSKINTTDYSSRKDFKKKKRKFGKKIYVVKPQELLMPDKHYLVKHKFSDKELTYFEEKLIYRKWHKEPVKVFVFTEPWRFVLRIRPNIITHTRLRDVVLEQRIKRIDTYIEQHDLKGTINRLVYGHHKWHWFGEDKAKERSPYKNKSLQQILNECRQELEIDNALNY